MRPAFLETSFCYKRHVVYHESDAMGVVHHSNYLRFFEEARGQWLRTRGLEKHHYPHAEWTMAVLESNCQFHRPAFVEDLLEIYLQVAQRKLKVEFRYAIYSGRYKEAIVSGATIHVLLDKQFRPVRIPEVVRQQLEKEIWTETWLSNS